MYFSEPCYSLSLHLSLPLSHTLSLSLTLNLSISLTHTHLQDALFRGHPDPTILGRANAYISLYVLTYISVCLSFCLPICPSVCLLPIKTHLTKTNQHYNAHTHKCIHTCTHTYYRYLLGWSTNFWIFAPAVLGAAGGKETDTAAEKRAALVKRLASPPVVGSLMGLIAGSVGE